jgi:hypothetical protein
MRRVDKEAVMIIGKPNVSMILLGADNLFPMQGGQAKFFRRFGGQLWEAGRMD